MLKALSLSALFLATPTAPETLEQPVVSPSAIVQVICPTIGGVSMGTAFRVGHSLTLSVKHVTSEGNCLIDGKPITVSYTSTSSDFSMIKGGGGPFLKVDCGGFVEGRRYLAIGYARGLPFQTTVALVATGKTSGGFAILTGIFTVVPGQSGGPIIDAETGEVVGTVNVYDFTRGMSGSVALKDTPVCAGKIA